MRTKFKSIVQYSVAKIIFVFVIAIGSTCLARAADDGVKIFFVSGILQKIDEPTTVKLVHIVQVGVSRVAAEYAFKDKALKDFPGFNLIDMISTPQSEVRALKRGDRRFVTNI